MTETMTTAMTEKTATLIRKMPNRSADVGLYRLDPPIKVGRGAYRYVHVSSVLIHGEPETMIFPSNEEGHEVSSSQLRRAFFGMSHAGALSQAGYELR